MRADCGGVAADPGAGPFVYLDEQGSPFLQALPYLYFHL